MSEAGNISSDGGSFAQASAPDPASRATLEPIWPSYASSHRERDSQDKLRDNGKL